MSPTVPSGEARTCLSSMFGGSLRKHGHMVIWASRWLKVNCPYLLLQVSSAGAERVYGLSWGLGRHLVILASWLQAFHLTGWGSFLSELDGRFSGKWLPWDRALVSESLFAPFYTRAAPV